MKSQSYIARPRETNIAKKIKENYCESQEKTISALIIEVAACAVSLKE